MAGEEDGGEGDTGPEAACERLPRRPFSSLILTRTRVASAVLRHLAKKCFACRPGRRSDRSTCWHGLTSVCLVLLRCHLALTAALLGFRRFRWRRAALSILGPPCWPRESPPRASFPGRRGYRPRARRSIRSRGGLGPHFQRAPNFSFFAVQYCTVIYCIRGYFVYLYPHTV